MKDATEGEKAVGRPLRKNAAKERNGISTRWRIVPFFEIGKLRNSNGTVVEPEKAY